MSRTRFTLSSSTCASSGGSPQRRAQDFVMPDFGVQMQQKAFVFGIVNRPFIVRAGEGLDRIPGFPERVQGELGLAAAYASQDPHPLIAGNGGIFLQDGTLQILDISVFVGFAGDPSPDARNHGLAPQPDRERTRENSGRKSE